MKKQLNFDSSPPIPLAVAVNDGPGSRLWEGQERAEPSKLSPESQKPSCRSLDPRAKLLILILINVTAISLSNLKMEVICVVLIGIALLWQGMLRTCVKYWLIYGGMLGVFALSGQHHNAATAMLAVMCIILRKTLPIFMFAASITAKTRVSELITAMQKIHVPKSIIIALAVTIRFFPTLCEEYSLISDAMKMRGIQASFRTVLLHPMRLAENILVPVMLRASAIAEDISAAAITRGIDSSRRRVSYYDIRFGVTDGVFILLFSALAVVSAATGR